MSRDTWELLLAIAIVVAITIPLALILGPWANAITFPMSIAVGWWLADYQSKRRKRERGY